MPVSFESLELRHLLHHQLAYECIDAVGAAIFDDWDVVAFEKGILGPDHCPAFNREEDLATLRGGAAQARCPDAFPAVRGGGHASRV